MRAETPIVITGFMGTGKSTVAPLVAQRLNRPFIDLDARIEEQAGSPIAEIFAQSGEAAFRQLEQQALRRALEIPNAVIATGGGALLAPSAQRVAMPRAVVIELRARPETILARLSAQTGRPLLDGDDWQARVQALYRERCTAYSRLPYHVETDNHTPADVADEILALLVSASPTGTSPEVRRLPVRTPTGAYLILVGDNAVADMRTALPDAERFQRVAMITDAHVAPLHAAALRAEWLAGGVSTDVYTIPAGERAKTLETVATLYERLLHDGHDRHSLIVTLGGGVVGDLGGFVAATYMRGIPFVQVPTSLLAMVDASVGGKVGVDHAGAKNIVGAFKHPLLVVADTTFLETLPPREIRNGLAEVVKHALIADPELLHWLERGTWAWPALVERAVRVKVNIVEQDPFEHGVRALLNLGHTFGHALETVSGFSLAHGEAVAVGLVLAARLAARLGMADESLERRITRVLKRLGLPTTYPADAEAVWRAMQFDKKKRGRQLRFILPRDVGQVEVVRDVPREAVLEVLRGA
nr:3-dehydroquinate synthase [Ardenticatena sp.]